MISTWTVVRLCDLAFLCVLHVILYTMARAVLVTSPNLSNLPGDVKHSTGPLLAFPRGSPWMWVMWTMCECAVSTVYTGALWYKGERLTHTTTRDVRILCVGLLENHC